MNRYLEKIAGMLNGRLGMPNGQPIPAQTLQVMSQVGDPATKKEAIGAQNLQGKGGHNRPAPTSKMPQKMPRPKGT